MGHLSIDFEIDRKTVRLACTGGDDQRVTARQPSLSSDRDFANQAAASQSANQPAGQASHEPARADSQLAARSSQQQLAAAGSQLLR